LLRLWIVSKATHVGTALSASVAFSCKQLIWRKAMADDFDWSDRDALVIRHQNAIAVYRNNDNHIVIRCQKDWDEEEDAFIVIDRKYAREVIDAIVRELHATAVTAEEELSTAEA
jgi:hypothetical protein